MEIPGLGIPGNFGIGVWTEQIQENSQILSWSTANEGL